MSKPKAETIKSVKQEWATSKTPDSILNFLRYLFGQLLGSSFPEIAWPVAHLAYQVSGTEIEGEEVSLGMIFVRNDDSYVSPNEEDKEAAISASMIRAWERKDIEPDELHQADIELKVLRKIVDVMRDNILGWVPGHYEHPVLVFSYGNDSHPKDIKLSGCRILRCAPHVADAGKAYRSISNPSRLAIYVKPYSTVQIYYNGYFLGHIVKLRDINSWAVRSFEHLKRFLTNPSIVKQKFAPEIIRTGEIDNLLLALMLISEEKKGAALYIVKKSQFDGALESLNRHKTDKSIPVSFVSNYKHAIHNEKSFNIKDMPLGELLTYLRQDGSVVIDEQGNWLGAGVYFNSQGGRKKTAEDLAMPERMGAHVFVVSQDGGFFFYSAALNKQFATPPPGEDQKTYQGVRLDFLPINDTEFKIRDLNKKVAFGQQPATDENPGLRTAL